MEDNQTQTKPRAYLDHNILIRLSNAKTTEFILNLKEDFQIIFSLETIIEIKRSVGFEDKLIEVLNQLDAMYLDVHLDSDNRISDSASIYRINLKERVEETDPEDITAEDLIAAGKLFSQKLMGGKPEMEFDEIIAIQEAAFSRHMDKLEKYLLESGDESIKIDTKSMRDQYSFQLKEIRNQLQDHHKTGIGFEGINLLRRELKTKPQILNNITLPNVFQKIWDRLKVQEFVKANKLTLDGLIGIEKNWTYPGKTIYVFDKVLFGYSFLNTVGFNPDEDLQKDNGFRASTSDQSHAAYGAFANYILTWDNKFAKKTKAVYEYFGINTVVVNFNEL